MHIFCSRCKVGQILRQHKNEQNCIMQTNENIDKYFVLHFFEHTDRFLVEMFQYYAFKECISVKNLKLWLLILMKTLFFNDHTYKTDIGQHFHRSEKIRQGGATVTKQLIYFSNADISTTLTLIGSPGMSREAKLSTEFEFGSLVR